MRQSTVWIIIVIIILIAVAVWISYSATNYGTQVPPNATTGSTTGSTTGENTSSSSPVSFTIGIATTTNLGTYLVDSSGMSLYTYSQDTSGVSNCTGTCAINWPPYIVSSFAPTLGNGINGSIASITRPDGGVQVTYKGKPLYRYNQDARPGDVKGNGVNGFTLAKP